MGRLLGSALMMLLLVASMGTAPSSAQPVTAQSVAAQSVAAGTAATWRPPGGASFNVPRAEPEFEWRSEKRIWYAIRNARKGSMIRVTIFSLDRKPMAEALVAARRRGVRVQVLLNNHQFTPAMRILRNGIGTDRTRSSFMWVCRYGCRSTGENLHTKMYLFSHTGAAQYVTMTGSHNLTGNAAVNQYNDLFTVRDHRAVYSAFNALFVRMMRDRPDSPLYYRKVIGTKYELQVLPVPNFGPNNDPMMDVLNRVRCHGATGGTGTNGRTKIRIANGAWDGYRGTYLAQKVRRLYGAGCDVRVIYGLAGKSVRDVFANRTVRGYLPVHVNGYDTDGDQLIDLYNHQKIITISGNWGGSSAAEYTWTGSSNWNNAGAKGDEIIFRIAGPGAGDRYRMNFDFIWRERSHLAKYIPYRVNGRTTALYTPADAPQPSPGGPAWEND